MKKRLCTKVLKLLCGPLWKVDMSRAKAPSRKENRLETRQRFAPLRETSSPMIYPKPSMSGSLYFNTENVDEVWDELKDKTPVEYPIETFDYGMREFAIRDCNGYLLQFGQDMS